MLRVYFTIPHINYILTVTKMRIKNSKTLFQINSIAIRLKPIGKRKKVSQRISKSDSSQQNIPQIHLMHTCVCLFCQLNAYHHSQRRNITHLSKHLNSASLGRVSPDKRQQAKGSQGEIFQRTADNPLSELERQFLTCFHSVLGLKSLPHHALSENHSEIERPEVVLSDESNVTAQIGTQYIAHRHAELSLASQ